MRRAIPLSEREPMRICFSMKASSMGMKTAMHTKLTTPNGHLGPLMREKLLNTVSNDTSTSIASTLRTMRSKLCKSSAAAKK